MDAKPPQQQAPTDGALGQALGENSLWGRVLQMHQAQQFMQSTDNAQAVTGKAPINTFMQLMQAFTGGGAQSEGQAATANTEQKAKDVEQKTAPKEVQPNRGGGKDGLNGFMKALSSFASLFGG